MCIAFLAPIGAALGASAASAAAVGTVTTLSALGTGASFFGQMQQANATAAAANYQAQVASNNAVIQERNAEAAIQAGQTEEQNQRRKTAQLEGAARAAIASNGISTTSGTSLDVLGDTAKLGELDALTIRSNAGRTAYNYRVEGMSQTAQAGLDVAKGQAAQSAGAIGGMSTLLSGATSLSDKFLNWQMAGLLT